MNQILSPSRATTIEDLQFRRSKMVSKEGFLRSLGFMPRSTDVVISPYLKSGTTWLQQIVHGLRTGGDMDFDDISRVVPQIETAHDLGLDLEAKQKAEPRAFKSHLPFKWVPKGCRYIVSLRDPRDALVSMYRFMEGWLLEPDTIMIEEFAHRVYFDQSNGVDYWTHFTSWWRQRDDPSVLLLAFENMKKNLPGTVARVAAFLDIQAEDALLDLVTRQSSIGFMLEHKNRFDDRLMREHSERVAGIPPGSDSAKVRKGEVGAHAYELTPELRAEFDSLWHRIIARECGLPSYQAAIDSIT